MANMKVFLTIVVTCLALGIINVEGLQCYNCIYVGSRLPPGINLTMLSDESCKSGSVPKSSFKVDCANITYDFIPGFDSRSLISSGINALYQSPKQTVPLTYTCAKLKFDGRFNARFGAHPFRGTIRTCIPSHRQITFQESCRNGTLLNVTSEVSDLEIRTVLNNYENILNTTETDTTVCSCHKKQNCNGGMTSAVALPAFLLIAASGMVAKGFW